MLKSKSKIFTLGYFQVYTSGVLLPGHVKILLAMFLHNMHEGLQREPKRENISGTTCKF
jgi:hypothetical protein